MHDRRARMPGRRPIATLLCATAACCAGTLAPAPVHAADSVPLGSWRVYQEAAAGDAGGVRTCVAAAPFTTLPLDFYVGAIEYSLRIDPMRAALREQWLVPPPAWLFANYDAMMDSTRTRPQVAPFELRFGDAPPLRGSSTALGAPPVTDYALGAAEPVLAAAARAQRFTIGTPNGVVTVRAAALPQIARALSACQAASRAGKAYESAIVRTPALARPAATAAVAAARERFIDALAAGRAPDASALDWPGGAATVAALVELRAHEGALAEQTVQRAVGEAIGQAQSTFTNLSFAATAGGELLPEARLATLRSLLLAWAVARDTREREDGMLDDDRYRGPFGGDVPAFAIADQVFRWMEPEALRDDAAFDATLARELGRAAYVRGRSLLRYGVLGSVDADLRYAAFELERARDATWLARAHESQAALLDALGLGERARALRTAFGIAAPAPRATEVRDVERASAVVARGWRAQLRRETMRSSIRIGDDDANGAWTFSDRWFSTMDALSLPSLLPADARTSLRPGVETAGLDTLLDELQRTPKTAKDYASAFDFGLLEVQAATRGEVLAELASRALLDPTAEERANVRDATAGRRAVAGEAWLRRERARLRTAIAAAGESSRASGAAGASGSVNAGADASAAAIRLRYLSSNYSARGVAMVYDTAIGTADMLALASGSDAASRNRLQTTTARYAVAAAGLQAGLGDREAVVVWYPAGAALHAFVVRRRAIDWVRTPVAREQIARHVAAVRASIDAALDRVRAGAEVSADSFATADAARLYALLVRPIEAELAGVDTLYVAPLGATGGIPAAVLADDAPRAGAAGAAPRWFGDRMTVVRMPALIAPGAFVRNRPPIGAARVAFLGVGAPPLGADAGASAALAANTDGAAQARSTAGSGGAQFRDANLAALPPLPNARNELATAARILGERDVEHALITGAGATRAAVLARLRTSSPAVLMFATHGLLGGARSGPGEPALVVARDGDDDGLLRMSDLVPLDLRAELVILSACATAPSGDDGAEPLAGLASAFLIAGARTVVASHWRIGSNVAETLTTGMLTNLRERKLGAGAALRIAMRELRADPETAHPVFWAPFEVIALPAAAERR